MFQRKCVTLVQNSQLAMNPEHYNGADASQQPTRTSLGRAVAQPAPQPTTSADSGRAVVQPAPQPATSAIIGRQFGEVDFDEGDFSLPFGPQQRAQAAPQPSARRGGAQAVAQPPVHLDSGNSSEGGELDADDSGNSSEGGELDADDSGNSSEGGELDADDSDTAVPPWRRYSTHMPRGMFSTRKHPVWSSKVRPGSYYRRMAEEKERKKHERESKKQAKRHPNGSRSSKPNQAQNQGVTDDSDEEEKKAIDLPSDSGEEQKK